LACVAKLAGPLGGAAESIDGGEERRRRRGYCLPGSMEKTSSTVSTSRGRILRSGFIARALGRHARETPWNTIIFVGLHCKMVGLVDV
jgi:hypothetical protein